MTKKNYDLAFEDYREGMKYKDIAQKYGVAVNTVKSWHRRYDWALKITQNQESPVENNDDLHTKMMKTDKYKRTRKNIESSLRKQAEENGITQAHYSDLINDYMSLWDVKNKLIADIDERGVTVEVQSGRSVNKKKNDSVTELNKTNAQMLKLLSELGLDASKVEKLGDEGDD
ncbi:P27 family phage terminase small subunit, partial [Bacillus sp. Hm123]|uniref:P27 family phage terminase small subunit n=1 Tax=Bacillus sp. Hm123 TaxID=3450745 RepID=UPI003F42DEE1